MEIAPLLTAIAYPPREKLAPIYYTLFLKRLQGNREKPLKFFRIFAL
jgi:hypothetical protein